MKMTINETRQIMDKTKKIFTEGINPAAGLITDRSDKMLCEVRGYSSYSTLINDGFSGKITQRKFEIILEDYFKKLNEASTADVLLNMLGKAVEYVKTKAIKALGAFASFLKKVVRVILTFKDKHPIIFWASVSIVIMLISSVLSLVAQAEVKSPSGKTLNADSVNMIIGVLEDMSRAAPDQTSDTAMKIGEFQKALLAARDNPNQILDLSQQGFFQEAFKHASDVLIKTGEEIRKSGGAEKLADYANKLMSIGKSMAFR